MDENGFEITGLPVENSDASAPGLTGIFGTGSDAQISGSGMSVTAADGSSGAVSYTPLVVEQFAPASPDTADYYGIKDFESVISVKAETHNFPTTVEPFNGAATGTGGEIRDRIAGGKMCIKDREILCRCVDHTRELLKAELNIRLGELEQDRHMSSLEKIFIEEKIFHDIEECTTWESVLETIDKGIDPFKPRLRREVTQEDIIRLTEIKIKRISKFDSFKADEHIRGVERDIKEVKHNLETLTEFTIAHFTRIKEKYGKGRERKTELREFDSIEATKVVVANAKLYVDREEGFFGIGPAMRKDEFVCDCSDIDDVIVITKEGKYLSLRHISGAYIHPASPMWF